FFFVQHLFSHRGDAGVTIDDPKVPGVYYTEIIEVEEPEQARYTAVLTLYYADLTKSEDTYVFIPALRRSLRLSTAARCSPAVGSDFSNDDTRHGAFNGNPTRFDADFIGDRNILEMPEPNSNLTTDDTAFLPPLYFPKPEVGKWQVRPSWAIDVRRIPSQRAGYCYGRRILYCDKEVYQSIWADLYDESNKLWKIDYDPQGLISVPGEGMRWTNDGWGIMFDVQAQHVSRVKLSGDNGSVKANNDCRSLGGVDYTDTNRYASVRGLAEIMR
ncbi:MAG TPA: outer membrane lipoprotein-sorting protein, partial [Candidatus Binataceae bacterium]|nr:outer membrane lipoprotein-sorting protein [Candidatus Binataceae bacterium]